MEQDRDAMVEEAQRLAVEYERRCTGCAQSVVAGLMDVLEVHDEGVFKAASGLADGIGLTGDGTCGALTGGCMVFGLLFGRERKDHGDMMKPMRSYLMSRELHDDFVQRYGSCRCHDIQYRLMGRTYDLYDPDDLRDAFNGDMMDHCSGVVGSSAGKAMEIILRQQADAER